MTLTTSAPKAKRKMAGMSKEYMQGVGQGISATIFGKQVLLDSSTPVGCIRMSGSTYMDLLPVLSKMATKVILEENE
jgi:hypothetical protein